jgi:hypothetical protein
VLLAAVLLAVVDELLMALFIAELLVLELRLLILPLDGLSSTTLRPLARPTGLLMALRSGPARDPVLG